MLSFGVVEGGGCQRLLEIADKCFDVGVHRGIALQIRGIIDHDRDVLRRAPFRARTVVTVAQLDKVSRGEVKGIGVKIFRKVKLELSRRNIGRKAPRAYPAQIAAHIVGEDRGVSFVKTLVAAAKLGYLLGKFLPVGGLHAPLVYAHALRQQVKTSVFTVIVQADPCAVHRGYAEGCGKIVGELVAELAYVAPVVYKVPMLAFPKAEKVGLGVQLYLVGVLIGASDFRIVEGCVSPASDLGVSAVFVGVGVRVGGKRVGQFKAYRAVQVIILAVYLLLKLVLANKIPGSIPSS